MQLRAFDSATEFLERTEDYLGAHESENSLLLGLALRTRDSADPGDEGTRFFTVEADSSLGATAPAGAILQTPGRAVVFTAMSPDAARLAARELPARLETLHGCLGPVETVDVVAEVWRGLELGTLGVHASMRLFELTELEPPRPAPGSLRLATAADLELCRLWLYRFMIDCNLPEATPGELPARVLALEQERLYLWQDGGRPVACAAWSRPLAQGVCVGYVYTPDELRGRGYASNVVAALTAGLLDGSLFQPRRTRVNLFTDLANPTSNSIYRKLGYRPLRDFRHYVFETQGA